MIKTDATHACDNECGSESSDLRRWFRVMLEPPWPVPVPTPKQTPENPRPRPTPTPPRRAHVAHLCSQKCISEWIAKKVST